MVENIISVIFTKDMGAATIFLSMLGVCVYYFRKDALSHKRDYRKTTERMMSVVDNNTRASVELSQIIKERIK